MNFFPLPFQKFLWKLLDLVKSLVNMGSISDNVYLLGRDEVETKRYVILFYYIHVVCCCFASGIISAHHFILHFTTLAIQFSKLQFPISILNFRVST